MSVLAIIFLLGLSACANSEGCPPYTEIAPCTCEEMADSGNIMVSCYEDMPDLKTLNKSLGSLVGKKNVELELHSVELGTVPSDFFAGIGVERLEISHCELDSLTEDESRPALHGLEDSLEDLTIISSFSEDKMKTKLRLGHLKRLIFIDLSYNTITELDNDWFGSGLTSLKYLTISNNEITKLGDKAFANLDNLRTLYFDGNRFGSVKRSLFPTSAKRLKNLELDNNALTTLPEDIFSDMPRLDSVSLRNNGIAKLEQKTWEHVWNELDEIYLEGNPIECDSHMTWMFNLRVTSRIHGTCMAPKEKSGISLTKFIRDKGQ